MKRDDIDITKLSSEDRVSVGRGGIEIRRQGRPVAGEVSGTGSVYLVIDCSASMAGDKLAHAKEGAMDFAKGAKQKRYAVGLIQFGSSASHVCGPQRELSALRPHVESLEVGGSTDMAGGIRMAAEMLKSARGARAMVVVTDGQPNSRPWTLDAANLAKRSGIDIITIGTDDADRALLNEIASRSDLSVMVPSESLGSGIASTAKMLPGT